MKGALYLLPTAALLLVLARMVALRLHQERAALFVFLLAWFFYSIIALLIFQQRPFDAAQYARTYLGLTAFIWLLGGVALLPAFTRLLDAGWPATLVLAAGFLALFLTHGILSAAADAGAGASDVRRTLILTCSMALVAGAAWLAASIGADDPDRTLWRGAGAFFFLYGAGAFAARIWPAAALELATIFLGAAAWTALAIFLAPTPDAIINIERLAIGRFAIAQSPGHEITKSPVLLSLSPRPTAPSPLGELTGTPECNCAAQCRKATTGAGAPQRSPRPLRPGGPR